MNITANCYTLPVSCTSFSPRISEKKLIFPTRFLYSLKEGHPCSHSQDLCRNAIQAAKPRILSSLNNKIWVYKGITIPQLMRTEQEIYFYFVFSMQLLGKAFSIENLQKDTRLFCFKGLEQISSVIARAQVHSVNYKPCAPRYLTITHAHTTSPGSFHKH